MRRNALIILCYDEKKERRGIYMKDRILKTLIFLGHLGADIEVNTECVWGLYQEKEPHSVEKLRMLKQKENTEK